jgi:transcriptional regulator with XRE-family HTH domain
MKMPKRADSVDKLVGQRIRAYRLGHKMSQQQLGKKVGVTFQQIQKYELGVNRIGSSRLKKIAATLKVPVAALFGGEEHKYDQSIDRLFTEILSKPYSARLLRAFAAIKSGKEKLALVLLAERMAQTRK